MKPYRAYGESAGPGGPNAQKLLSVDDFERESITRPGSLGDTIRKRREMRQQRGPTNMARYARESKAQGG